MTYLCQALLVRFSLAEPGIDLWGRQLYLYFTSQGKVTEKFYGYTTITDQIIKNIYCTFVVFQFRMLNNQTQIYTHAFWDILFQCHY